MSIEIRITVTPENNNVVNISVPNVEIFDEKAFIENVIKGLKKLPRQ